MKKSVQNERLKKHLSLFGSITPTEAISEYGIVRLAQRMKLLKDKGMPIVSIPENGVNKFGDTIRWTRYYLRADDVIGYGVVKDCGKRRNSLGKWIWDNAKPYALRALKRGVKIKNGQSCEIITCAKRNQNDKLLYLVRIANDLYLIEKDGIERVK